LSPTQYISTGQRGDEPSNVAVGGNVNTWSVRQGK
jgi:hypothetical protein